MKYDSVRFETDRTSDSPDIDPWWRDTEHHPPLSRHKSGFDCSVEELEHVRRNKLEKILENDFENLL